MFAHRLRLAGYITFTAAVFAGLLAFVRIALPFEVSPGQMAVNYVENSPGISSAGMPTRSQLAEIGNAGFDTVINLVASQTLRGHEDEGALAEQTGMRYFNIPVEFASPRQEDFERFARVMHENREKRILVHYQMGMRASTFVLFVPRLN